MFLHATFIEYVMFELDQGLVNFSYKEPDGRSFGL